MRFLSHAEMLRVFQRACVRAGIPVHYSEGFNPRPKLSLPLPRPVGVASDDELLCLRADRALTPDFSEAEESRIKAELAGQVPEGCELRSVNIVKPGASFQPRSATYILPTRRETNDERLKTRIDQLLTSKNLHVRRRIGAKGSRVKNVDVRRFFKSIELTDRDIIVQCMISPTGSIRVDEILELLELDNEKLSGPIRRTNVGWQSN